MKWYGDFSNNTIKEKIFTLMQNVRQDVIANNGVVFSAFFTGYGTVVGVATLSHSIMSFLMSVNSRMFDGWYVDDSSYSIYEMQGTQI